MASTVLHIKDAYYFEVPKFLWPSHRPGKAAFPDVWVKLDPEFQLWEAERIHAALAKTIDGVPDWSVLKQEYLAWKQEHHNVGKPLDVMLEQRYDDARSAYEQQFLGERTEIRGCCFSRTRV